MGLIPRAGSSPASASSQDKAPQRLTTCRCGAFFVLRTCNTCATLHKHSRADQTSASRLPGGSFHCATAHTPQAPGQSSVVAAGLARIERSLSLPLPTRPARRPAARYTARKPRQRGQQWPMSRLTHDRPHGRCFAPPGRSRRTRCCVRWGRRQRVDGRQDGQGDDQRDGRGRHDKINENLLDDQAVRHDGRQWTGRARHRSPRAASLPQIDDRPAR